MAEKTNNSQFKSSIEIPSGIKPINGQNFPILQGEYIEVTSRTDKVTPGNSAEQSHATLEDRLQDLEDDKINREGSDSINGDFNIKGDASIEGSTEITGNTIIEGFAEITGKNNLDVGLKVENNLEVGPIIIDPGTGIARPGVAINSNGTIESLSDITTYGKLNVDKEANFMGKITAFDSLFKGSVEVEKDMVVSGNLTIIGKTISEDHTSMMVKDSLIYIGCELNKDNEIILPQNNNGLVGIIMALGKENDSTYGYGLCYDTTNSKLKYIKGTITGKGAGAEGEEANLTFTVEEENLFIPTIDNTEYEDSDILLNWNPTDTKISPAKINWKNIQKKEQDIFYFKYEQGKEDENYYLNPYIYTIKLISSENSEQINLETLIDKIYSDISTCVSSLNTYIGITINSTKQYIMYLVGQLLVSLEDKILKAVDSRIAASKAIIDEEHEQDMSTLKNELISKIDRQTQSYFYCGAAVDGGLYTVNNLGINKKTYIVSPVKSITITNFEDIVENIHYVLHEDDTYSSIDLSYTIIFTIAETTSASPFVLNLPEGTYKWAGVEPTNFYQNNKTYALNFERIIINKDNPNEEKMFLCSWVVF